ncbi:MAG: thioredoxin family protein [Persicimonas sp.]
MTKDPIVELTDANFDARVLRSARPVVVAFVAPWSSAWKRAEPGFEALSDALDDLEIAQYKVDVDDHPEAASNYSVTTLPTFLLFANGRVVGRILGAASRGTLAQWIHRTIDNQ